MKLSGLHAVEKDGAGSYNSEEQVAMRMLCIRLSPWVMSGP